VDASTGSDVEDPCEEENKGGQHRQNLEANRGRNAAKGFQSRIITRFPGLKLRTSKAPWPLAMAGEVGLKAKYTGGTGLCGPLAGFEIYQGCHCQAH